MTNPSEISNPKFSLSRNPYTQAFLTYSRRWLFRLVAIWTLACLSFPLTLAFCQYHYWHASERAAVTYSARKIESDGPDELAILSMFLAVILLPAATAIASHARDQTTSWRGTIFPNARRPHLLFAASFLTLLPLVVTGAFSLLFSPWSVFAFLSFAATITALGAACASLPPKGIALTGIGSIAIFSLHPVRLWLAYGLFGQSPAVPCTLLFFAILTLISLFAYLSLTRTERTPATPSDLLLGTGTRWTRRPGESLPTMSLPRRVQLWRLPSTTGLMPPAFAAALLGLILAIVRSRSDGRLGDAPIAFPLAAISIILPGAAVATQWTRRLPSLGYELARPTTRPQFLRDLARSIAVDWAYWWSWLTLAGLLGSAYTAHWMTLHLGSQWAPTWQSYALAITLSAAVQSLLFGLSVWVLSYQTSWSTYLLVLPASLSSWLPVIWILHDHAYRDPRLTTLATLSLPATGLLLIACAYRRWLRVDLV